jgi:hypothetical protein
VIGLQLAEWRDFRRLQRFARGQSAYDYWRSAWEESGEIRPKYLQWHVAGGPDCYSEDDWKQSWQLTKSLYGDRRIVRVTGQYRPWEQFVKRKGHTTEQQGFPEYAEALKERLTKHGFTRTFQLDEDPARQDKLTTWIEYLGYQYWWYDQHEVYKRFQGRYDAAWKKLVDAKVLRPFETVESITNFDSLVQRVGEEERAEKAVESAKSAVMAAPGAISDPRCSSGHSSPQNLAARQSNLDAALQRLESIKRRNDLLSEFSQRTRNYRLAKKEAERHEILLRWMSSKSR